MKTLMSRVIAGAALVLLGCGDEPPLSELPGEEAAYYRMKLLKVVVIAALSVQSRE